MKHTSYILVDYKNHTVEMRLSMRVFKEDNYFFAECPELQLLDQGRFPREAADSLIDMIQASIMEAILTNNLDKMLNHLNFKKNSIPNRKYFSRNIDPDDELLPLNVDAAIPYSREQMATI